MWNKALLLVMLSASVSAAQLSSARIAIVGRISNAGSLSFTASGPGIAASQSSMTGRQVRVRLRPSLATRTVSIPLIARSNARYRILVKSVTRQDGADQQPIRLILRSADPNAGTLHLMRDATNVHAMEGKLVGMGDETTIVEGPRISSGGTDATADNALRLVLEAELPQSLSEAELVFTMELY